MDKLTPPQFINLPEKDQKKYLSSLSDKDEFLALVEQHRKEKEWLDQLNEETRLQADKLSKVFNCPVEPFIFVIEPLKDAAVGFFRTQSAKQLMKIMRTMAEDQETGMEQLAKVSLIRDADLAAAGMEGSASDPRFMDVNGIYDPANSALNFNLIKRATKLITLFTDEFKKK